jgi:hypothetical protein
MAPDANFRLSPITHSHNAYLQVQNETGAAGALILLCRFALAQYASRRPQSGVLDTASKR